MFANVLFDGKRCRLGDVKLGITPDEETSVCDEERISFCCSSF